MSTLITLPDTDISKDIKSQIMLANQFLIGRTEEQISKDTGVPLEMVKYILTQDKIQDYIHKSSSNLEVQLHLKRINRANVMLDVLLDKIDDEIINNPEFKLAGLRDSQVKLLVDLYFTKLPNAINGAIKTAIQINFGNQNNVVEEKDNPLKDIVNKLEPGAIIIFWNLVEAIGDLLIKGELTTLDEIKKILNINY